MAILYRAPSGVPGDITRASETTVEAAYFDQAKVSSAFGVAVKLVAGKLTAIEEGDSGIKIFGVLARHAPAISGPVDGSPNPKALQSVVTEGYINVLCKIGTPVRGGKVYVCRTANLPTIGLGEFSATLTANVQEVSGYSWAVDGLDESKNAEIKVSFNNTLVA
jgi:hypothetical protein